jgi:choline dehydrogenase-like flavoprotein
LDGEGKTQVTIQRLADDDLPAKKKDIVEMTAVAIDTVGKVPQADFFILPQSDEGTLQRLPLGALAHELGSIPMPQEDGCTACLDSDLSLRGFTNVSVCGLSVLPVSLHWPPSTSTVIPPALQTSADEIHHSVSWLHPLPAL